MVVWFLRWGLVVEDKEKAKEEDISWLFLWGATILYTVVICMAFAGMVVTRPTVGAAFLEFTKDYSTLLAGIPVLIAVLVAKQQLDANRRQHVSNVKRTFQKELDLIRRLRQMANNVDKKDVAYFYGLSRQLKGLGEYLQKKEQRWLDMATDVIPDDIIEDAETIRRLIKQFCDDGHNGAPSQETLEERRARISNALVNFDLSLDRYHSSLAQYWS